MNIGELLHEYPASRLFMIGWRYTQACAVFFAGFMVLWIAWMHYALLFGEWDESPSPMVMVLFYLAFVWILPLVAVFVVFLSLRTIRRRPRCLTLFENALLLTYPGGATKTIFRDEIRQIAMTRSNDLFEVSAAYQLELTLESDRNPKGEETLSIPVRQIPDADEFYGEIHSRWNLPERST